jgi:CRISPR-associated endonuclease/helicase Cas3
LLVEAPMGEGKTEAALYAHLELQRRLGHRGLYVALPTKATGNAMFSRVLKFLRGQRCDRPLDMQLLHGGALLNDDFQKLKADVELAVAG